LSDEGLRSWFCSWFCHADGLRTNVANRPKVRPHNSKRGRVKKSDRPDKSAAESGRIFSERIEKGPDFEPVLLPLFSLECIEKLDFSNILILKGLKNLVPFL
jgi:hypothetical protein